MRVHINVEKSKKISLSSFHKHTQLMRSCIITGVGSVTYISPAVNPFNLYKNIFVEVIHVLPCSLFAKTKPIHHENWETYSL